MLKAYRCHGPTGAGNTDRLLICVCAEAASVLGPFPGAVCSFAQGRSGQKSTKLCLIRNEECLHSLNHYLSFVLGGRTGPVLGGDSNHV